MSPSFNAFIPARQNDRGRDSGSDPPLGLLIPTAILAIALLAMAFAETSLIGHFLVDRGERLSLLGLCFACGYALVLYRRKRLKQSLPLMAPWLLYPLITQADQLIDNLAIGQMRLISHLFLALLFALPIVCLAQFLSRSRTFRVGREAMATVLGCCLLVEAWLAHRFIGEIMIALVVVGGIATLLTLELAGRRSIRPSSALTERTAFGATLAAASIAAGAFFLFSALPGSYQGSPHYYHDPTHPRGLYDLSLVSPGLPLNPREYGDLLEPASRWLAEAGRAFESLLGAYYSLDRSYNTSFHNALFLRKDPFNPDFRVRALAVIEDIRGRGLSLLESERTLLMDLPKGSALATLIEDTAGFLDYSLERAAILETETARFERTEAGLQHATHMYEGEGKVLGEVLADLVSKHHEGLQPLGEDKHLDSFLSSVDAVRSAYADRIVGF